MPKDVIKLPFDVKLPPAVKLCAGEMTCLYVNGNLRSIRIGHVEIIRMIYPAVRDQNWDTASYEIKKEIIKQRKKSFLVSYVAHYKLKNINYKALVTIEGREDNTICFKMNGISLSSFNRNRIGLCVHHPIKECAGKSVKIIHATGKHINTIFPKHISPDQPLKDISGLQWAPAEGIDALLLFEGDIFETEDQRNWTDSSFKTYSTPLDIPYPVKVAKGEKVKQQVLLKLSIKDKPPGQQQSYLPNETRTPFPKIGYCRPLGNPQLNREEIEVLKRIPFDHYRIEVKFEEINWMSEVRIALAEAALLNTSLELSVFFNSDVLTEANLLIKELDQHQSLLNSILVLQKDEKTTQLSVFQIVYDLLKENLPFVKVGFGTDAYFAELNRNFPNVKVDFVSFSINPQVHARDTFSLIENLEDQHHILDTINFYMPGTPVHISPITLNRRYNTDALDEQSKAPLPADSRQYSSFAAFWTLHCIKNLCKAERLTLYQTTGDRGLIKYHDSTLVLSPIYQALEAIKGYNPKYIVTNTSNASFYDGIILEK